MARSNHRLPKIPEMTIRRLSVYTRCLLQLEEDGVKTISSQELAERFSLNSAQVRKDLAYFGEFGVRGIGYYVSGLKAELHRILGLDREWTVALVGLAFAGLGLVINSLATGYDFFSYYMTLALTPMMMLSGVFFPVDQLPAAVQWAAQALPLWHGVALTRPLLLGEVPQGILLHVAVLLAYALGGFYLAVVLTRRRLLT